MTLSRTIIAPKAAVASEQPLASIAAYDVLKNGGNAFDAAVATSFALAVTFHPAGGLGGDFFGTFFEAKSGKVTCLNSSGWSPSGLNLDLVERKGGGRIPTHGPLTCVVPGMISGVHAMHSRYGSKEFKELLQPSLTYATEGFPAGDALCRSIAGSMADLSNEATAVFAPGGAPPVPGETIVQAALGKVIKDVSESGPDAFYKGWPAKAICAALEKGGVPTSLEDFLFQPEWVEPVSFDYRGTKVYETPPNSMGATSLLMLKVLSEGDVHKKGPLSRERLMMTMEAAEYAYARRDEFLGDPRFSPFDFKKFMAGPPLASAPPSRLADGDTTAFSVVDAAGNIVSGIQSLFHHFGSRVFVPETGVMLSNRGAGFATRGPNKVEPHKRPLHTLSSLILERDGQPFIGIGASGGEYRPMQHALFVTNLVDYQMPLEAAVDHPRFLWSGGKSMIAEKGYQTEGLARYDVNDLPFPGRTGVCQAVEIQGRFRKAVCDVRGDGVPSGF